MKVVYFILLYCVAEILADCSDSKKTIRSRLADDLLCNYDSTVRPIKNEQNATIVSVRMILKSINYDIYRGSLCVNGWLVVTWDDEHLKWDSANYEGLTFTHMSSYSIWTPDISVYNKIDQEGDPSVIGSIKCLVYNYGSVICIVPTKVDSLCQANLRRFPFDVQNCSIRFGSWVHSGEEIDLKVNKPAVSTDDFIDNGEWKLIRANASRHDGIYECCPNNTYPSLIFNFQVERHSGSQVCLSIVPTLVMIMLTMSTLCISPNDSERMIIICVNILCHMLYLQFFSWQIPVTGPEPALLTLYARDSLLLNGFLCLLTIILKILLNKKNTSPLWISTIVTNVISIRPLQLILIFDDNLKNFGKRVGDDDRSNIIDNSEDQKNNDYLIFAGILDKLCFFIYFVIYFIMFIAFIP